MLRDLTCVPANRFFNFSLITQSAGCAELSMPLQPSYLQEGGVVHGGIISALADTCAVYALLPSLPENQSMTSIEFKINFLAPARLEDGDLRAAAQVVKQGKTVGLCDVEVFQKERRVAKGLFTYFFF